MDASLTRGSDFRLRGFRLPRISRFGKVLRQMTWWDTGRRSEASVLLDFGAAASS